MKPSSLFQSLLLIAGAAAQNTTYLTATALVTNAQNNSALQCWQFTTPLEVPTTPGVSGSLLFSFNLSTTAEFAAIPPRYDGGIHNAPRPQFVIFSSGLAHISLPYGDDEAWVLGGANGLIVAADTVGTGHRTQYPTDETTISFQLPFLDGEPPEYKVASEGPCHGDSQLIGG